MSYLIVNNFYESEKYTEMACRLEDKKKNNLV